MRNKNLKSVLLLMLVLFTFNAVPGFAKKLTKASHQAPAAAGIAGVGGASGSSLSVNSLLKEKLCLTDGCKELGKEMVGLVNLIEANEEKMFTAIDKIKDKDVKSLKKDYDKALEAIENNENDLNLAKDLEAAKTKLVELASQSSCYVNTFKTEVDSDRQKLKKLMDKYEEEYKNSKKEDSSSTEGSEDDLDFSDLQKSSQYDVEPSQMISLKQGDLLAWGIPYVPSIPLPKPKAQPQAQSAVTQEVTATPKVSDKTFQALDTIEVNSSKISEAQKDQFLSGLRSK